MLRVLFALAVVATVAAASAPTVEAHAAFVTATPAPDSSLAAAPGQVSVIFTETVTRSGTSITVIGPNGATVSGATSINDNTAATALSAGDAGTYTVNWSNVSAIDGHENSGAFRFTVAAASAPAPQPSAAAAPTQTAPRPAAGAAPASPQTAGLPPTGTGLVADAPLTAASGAALLSTLVLVAMIPFLARYRRRRS